MAATQEASSQAASAAPHPRVVRDGAVLTIMLDAPGQANAVGEADLAALRAIVAAATSDPGLRVAILTGTGRNFCAGYHLGQMGTAGRASLLVNSIAQSCALLAALPVPLIGALGGPAVGAGVELALSCDVLIAAPAASFAIPAARLGLLYDPGSMSAIAARLGPSLARRLFLAGEVVSADMLRNAGVFAALVDGPALAGAARALAERIAGYSPRALAATKQVLAGRNHDAVMLTAAHVASPDFDEALAALGERRPPRFDDS